MLDRVCQLLEEVIPTAPRPFLAQVIQLCVHLTKDPGHPGGRRLTGLDRVLGVNADGSWRLECVL